MRKARFVATVALVALSAASAAVAQQKPAPTAKPSTAAAPPAVAGVTPPADYVIGPEDVLTVQFWRDDQMSAETVVRPDGMITIKLINDVKAAGLTIPQLRDVLKKEGSRFLEDPEVTVGVKAIKSRFVNVLGEVAKQGPIPINGPMTVLDALGLAGGPTEYAKKNDIRVIRNRKSIRVQYESILEGKKLEQNIDLMPGDQVVVP